MINEDVLSTAAAEATQAIINSLPAPAECKHEFTPSFQKKMRRTMLKAKHPNIYILPKQVACFVISAIIIGSTWLTVDADARATFFAWIQEKYEVFIEYRFVGNPSSKNDSPKYELTWLPNGYSEIDRLTIDGGRTVIYSNGNDLIQFAYSNGTAAASLFIGDFAEDVQTVQVGNVYAKFYQSRDDSGTNTIVWLSEQNDTLFSITAALPERVMLKLCKSVQSFQ